MLNKKPLPARANPFEKDVFDWFSGRRHGHMGKWQYIGPKFKGDPCRGNELWDIWENTSGASNMLNRQHKIIQTQVPDMVRLTGLKQDLIDLGPGGKHAVLSNTLPFVNAYGDALKTYTAVDLNENFCTGASAFIRKIRPDMKCIGLCRDVYDAGLTPPPEVASAVLFCGGTIGNYEAEQNTPHAIAFMAGKLKQLKDNLPSGSTLFIGLEATQDPDLLYGDYDHAAHAEYEINVMYAIKRDLLSPETGFLPQAWKYAMKWWPEAHQFCHIAQATAPQKFKMNGVDFNFSKGHQLVVDNSFKFPVLAMQRAAQIAKIQYVHPFSDNEGRMVMHALNL